MIVLDTNVVSETLRPAPNRRVLSWLTQEVGSVATTAITLAEIMHGVQCLPDGKRRDQLSQDIDRVARPLRGAGLILPFDEAAADHYAEIMAVSAKRGRQIPALDAQIAAICLANDAVCATRNTRDFEGTGVSLIDPWGT